MIKIFIKNNYNLLITIVLLFIFFILSFSTAKKMSITCDERTHLVSGYEYIKNRDFRWNPEHPPLLKEIAAIPLLFMNINEKEPHSIDAYKKVRQWEYSEKFLFFYNGDKFPKLLIYPRAIMIFFGVLLGIFIFLWARELYGNNLIAILPLLLYVFSPDFIAHSSLITTDVGSVAFLFISFYFLWRLNKTLSLKYFILSSLFFGLAQSSKHSSFLALPIYFLLLIVIVFLKTNIKDKIIEYLRKYKYLVFFIFMYVFILRIFRHEKFLHIYQFINISVGIIILFHLLTIFENKLNLKKHKKFLEIKNFILISLLLIIISFTIIVLTTSIFYLNYENSLLKRNFTISFNKLSYIINHAKEGHGYILLNGKYSKEGFKHYYLYLFLVKTPLITLFLILSGIIILLKKYKTKYEIIIFILLPPILFLILISFFNKTQIGIRHEFFIYPFLYLITGETLKIFKSQKKILIIEIIIFIILILTVIRNFPDFIPYTNGIFFKKEKAYLYINDSNVDWGQAHKQLAEFLEKKKYKKIYLFMHYKFFPYYLKNKINVIKNILIINNLDGLKKVYYNIKKTKSALIIDAQKISETPELYKWIKDKKPDYIIGKSILIFE